MLFQKWLVVLLVVVGIPLGMTLLVQPYMDLGRARHLCWRSQYAQALRLLDRGISIGSSYGQLFALRGLVYDHLKQTDKAAADYDEALKRLPDDPVILNNRGWLEAETGKFEQSVADTTRALPLASDELKPYILDTRGYAYLKSGKLDLALRDLHQAIELNSAFVPAIIHRSICQRELGHEDLARADELRAYELGGMKHD